MMNQSGVTIAIPFFNCRAYLPEAIKSVFSQSHEEWELLLIDDGSTDGSLEFAEAIDDPRVRVISDGKNLGLPARLNQVAELATYELIARMDADDLMSPHRLSRQLQVLTDDPSVDLVSTGLFSMDDNRNLQGARGKDSVDPSLSSILRGNAMIVHASIIYRREWLLRNPYNPAVPLVEDWELWVRAKAKNDLRLRTIADPLYVYREGGNVTRERLLGCYRSSRLNISPLIPWGPLRAKFLLKSLLKSAIIAAVFSERFRAHLLKRRHDCSVPADLRRTFLSIIASTDAAVLPLKAKVPKG